MQEVSFRISDFAYWSRPEQLGGKDGVVKGGVFPLTMRITDKGIVRARCKKDRFLAA